MPHCDTLSQAEHQAAAEEVTRSGWKPLPVSGARTDQKSEAPPRFVCLLLVWLPSPFAGQMPIASCESRHVLAGCSLYHATTCLSPLLVRTQHPLSGRSSQFGTDRHGDLPTPVLDHVQQQSALMPLEFLKDRMTI